MGEFSGGMRHRTDLEAAHRGGANIVVAFRLFNAAVLAVAFAGAACNKDAVTPDGGVSDGGVPGSAAPNIGPPPAVPAPPAEVLQEAGSPPAWLGVAPGDPAAVLRARRPNARPSSLTPRILTEALADALPFLYATYQLTREAPERVETVALTLRPAYAHPAHFDALARRIDARLGAGKPFDEAPYGGLRWQAVGYRIDLRRDRGLGDSPELVFDLRGGREVEVP
jgi:hypothetical protein